MNAKRCKRLRKVARLLTLGKPAVGYEGQALNQTKWWRRTVRVDPQTTRGVYLHLKKVGAYA
jgi:hypothetical protein